MPRVYLQWAHDLGQRINQPVRVPLHACEHDVLYSKPMEGVPPNMPGNSITTSHYEVFVSK